MRKGIVSLAAVAMAIPAVAGAQSLDQNFDSLGTPGTSTLNYTAIPGFTVTGNVDLVQSGEFSITCASGSGKCIDLDGTTGPGKLTSSPLAYTAGRAFTLSFDASGNQRDANQSDTLELNFDFGQLLTFDGTCSANAGCTPGTGFQQSTAFFSYTFGGADPFQTFTYTVTPYTSGFLTFSLGTTSADNIGPIIDNVSVAGAVPEPATWALMILGFGAVGGAMRRRQAAKATVRFA